MKNYPRSLQRFELCQKTIFKNNKQIGSNRIETDYIYKNYKRNKTMLF